MSGRPSPSTSANVPGATFVSVMCGRLPSPAMTETAVVTAFVEDPHGQILLVRRASTASAHPGLWSAITAPIEEEDAHERALVEVEAVTGLGAGELELLGRGPALAVPAGEGEPQLVHALRFRCSGPAR